MSSSAVCSTLAKTHYENFPVGRFIEKSLRPHVHAIYAFARTADDFADEPQFEGQRLELLQEWRKRLYLAQHGSYEDPIFEALAKTFQEHQLPIELCDDLIKAFEYDVTHSRHSNFESLLTYSEKSANPVGRMMLWLHGYRQENLFKLSDAICTALQLTNFWQDVAIDLKKDRVYIPQSSLQASPYTEQKLFQHIYNDDYVALMKPLHEKTKNLFMEGRSLCDQVSGKLAFELRLIWSGGFRILECLEKRHFDVFTQRPTLLWTDKGLILWRTLLW